MIKAFFLFILSLFASKLINVSGGLEPVISHTEQSYHHRIISSFLFEYQTGFNFITVHFMSVESCL